MPALDKSPAELLATPAQFIKGVGPQRAELLDKLGAQTARDLLFCFPRDYQDLTNLRSIDELEDGAAVRLRGSVVEVEQRTTASGSIMLGVLVRSGGGHVRLLWFNQPFLQDRFAPEQELLITGKVRQRGLVWEMSHPQTQWLDSADETPADSLLPVYPLTEGLNQAAMRKLMRGVVDGYAALLDDVFPPDYLAQHDLASIHEAVKQLHFPSDRTQLERARRRLAYQELLILQLALALRRQRQRGQATAAPLEPTARIDARIRRLFPYELTPGQLQAIAEVGGDMARPQPMNRLLQGDVGSGKTAVAVYALLLAVAHGQQAALMAPTEVLASQHARTLEQVLRASQVRWALLTGAVAPAQRKEVLARLAAGDLDLVIGTQAIVESDAQFARLALVVIDEQHKFGVLQRASLKQAGLDPHYLVMTATPIPRTVAMTQYGDLDISTLRDSPPGRQAVHTYLAGPELRERWWEFVRKKLREGRQGYVVTPLVEESEAIQAASLDEAFEALSNGPLEAFRLGMAHGRMPPAARQEAMEAFRQGKIQVLVATTVVEVGVDVPNATLMTIEGAERFGLSQLHQLRGRVSRGAQPGFCCAFASAAGSDAQRRLEAFAKTTDGFALAELDFEMRGPGDLMGTRQHGLPPLRIADPRRDAPLLELARRDAQAMVEADPALAAPERAKLRRMVLVRYGKVLELGDVG